MASFSEWQLDGHTFNDCQRRRCFAQHSHLLAGTHYTHNTGKMMHTLTATVRSATEWTLQLQYCMHVGRFQLKVNGSFDVDVSIEGQSYLVHSFAAFLIWDWMWGEFAVCELTLTSTTTTTMSDQNLPYICFRSLNLENPFWSSAIADTINTNEHSRECSADMNICFIY